MSAPPALPEGYGLIALAEIDSTNAEAMRRARAGAADRTVVWALEQTGGRGRRGRPWRTGAGNLACTVLLRPEVAPQVAAQLGFVAALAIADMADTLLGRPVARVKWPNDVLIDDRKLSGILVESTASAPGRIEWAVVGMGVNLINHPDDTETPATDLAAEGAGRVVPSRGAEILLAHFEERRAAWATGGFAALRDDWLRRGWRLGEPIRVRLERETMEGRFVGLDRDGVLVLELSSGLKRMVAAGDVFPVAGAGEADAAGGRRR
ncbi:MAG: biotin--[acetyl-CoA-carboxylase] ligase [Alphaproteobacteria bacterium]